ncbi:MAG: hypothetical protein ACP5I3_04665 [Thermoproteus sp.]|jgi:hypothetical protein
MRGILFVGKESPLASHADALRKAGVKVVLVPGTDIVLYTYDERRGGSIEVEGEEALKYLYDLRVLSSPS